MPRILGVDIPMNKRVKYALQAIYGIGPAIAEEIIVKANIDPNLKPASFPTKTFRRSPLCFRTTTRWKATSAVRS